MKTYGVSLIAAAPYGHPPGFSQQLNVCGVPPPAAMWATKPELTPNVSRRGTGHFARGLAVQQIRLRKV